VRDDNPNKAVFEGFYGIGVVASIVNAISYKARDMFLSDASLSAVGAITSRGRSFKGNQRKERAVSRRRGMKMSAR